MPAPRTILAAASVLGFASVALGAFGAHAFKSFLQEQGRWDTYQTAVQYQMYHSLALFLVGILAYRFPDAGFSAVSLFFLWGIFIFSGSLYALCASGLRFFGAITPLGGAGFLAGWAWLAWKIRHLPPVF